MISFPAEQMILISTQQLQELLHFSDEDMKEMMIRLSEQNDLTEGVCQTLRAMLWKVYLFTGSAENVIC
jgi:hypothetical protein